ncbi:PIN domain-like protein [Violaceomyces palustris]|uniref:PIN domain-like protein n=1 Tax=Violaceomyces palustris TaxID=1673888 RepID=A0ACD0NPF0_9BASI|nr:PIN domain-like protein [Violaceomyces palustris]
MGVQGLWQLVQPVARPIKLETLEGKRLAIDSSIWLYHFQMAMRDKQGRTLSNAHILGFLWRILKLLFHGIRPVFVFDGGAPVMKRRTLANRKARREGAKESHARTAEKLLAARLRQAALRQVASAQGAAGDDPSSSNWIDEEENDQQRQQRDSLGDNTVYFDDLDNPTSSRSQLGSASKHNQVQNQQLQQHSSPSSSPVKPTRDWHKDPYALPAMERDLNNLSASNGKGGKRTDVRFATESELRQLMSSIAPEDLDMESPLFRSLPPELQYELVGDLRVQSRTTSYRRLQAMLAASPTPIDFSRAQVAGLKSRNELTQKVLTVTDELGSANIKVPIRVAGERNKEYVLVRNPGSEGGFVLGVKDVGTSASKPIDVDQEYEDQAPDISDEDKVESELEEEEEEEMEMEEVEIPDLLGRPGSAEEEEERRKRTQEEDEILRTVSDPIKRKEMALGMLKARARYHARQVRKEAGLESEEEEMVPIKRSAAVGEKPLFKSPKGRSVAAGGGVTIQISSASEDEQDLGFNQDLEYDVVDADEAEDLARALEASEREARRSEAVACRSGDQEDRVDSSSPSEGIRDHQHGFGAEAGRNLAPSPPPPTTPSQTIEAQGDEEEEDEQIEFEEVEIQEVGPERHIGRGEWPSSSPPESRERKATPPRASTTPQPNDQEEEDVTESVPEPEINEPVSRPMPRILLEPIEGGLDDAPAQVTAVKRSDSVEKEEEEEENQPEREKPEPADFEFETKEVSREVFNESQCDDGEEGKIEHDSGRREEMDEHLMMEEIQGEVAERAEGIAPDDDEEEKVEEEEGGEHDESGDPADPLRDGNGEEPRVEVDDPSEPETNQDPQARESAERGEEEVASRQDSKTNREEESGRPETPIEWSPTPSPEPVALGADGFPLPTAEEMDAMMREEEEEVADLRNDQNEFVAFLSSSKGRSLIDIQQEVEREVNALRAEHANTRRSEEDVTKQMAQEIQMMLRLFGLPYVTAPMEAEAQCAELVSRRLVDGIITDDSDVFLFGGTRVYKNMFNDKRIVECFLLSDLERELGLDRAKLVRLAYFLGSDYTEGLPGVGPVLAMELLSLFPGERGLADFREWWLKVQMGKDTKQETEGKSMRRIKKALRNKVHLSPTWPEPEVLDAYYQPTVDESDEPFSWGLPDLDSLRTFLQEYLHWPVSKTDQYLLPIIERQNQRSRSKAATNQSTLDSHSFSFFDSTAGTGVYAGRKKPTYASNRLQEVVDRFRSSNKVDQGKKARQVKGSRRGRRSDVAEEEELSSSDQGENLGGGGGGSTSGSDFEIVGEVLPTVEGNPSKGQEKEVGGRGEGGGEKRRRGKGRGARVEEEGNSSEGDGSTRRSKSKRKEPQRKKTSRGRGRGGSSSRGRGTTLRAARSMNLDGAHQLPESRSPSVMSLDGRGKGASIRRRSSSGS